MHKRLTNGRVLLGSLGFILLMGLVGRIDCETQQAVLEDKVAIRDAIKARAEEDQRIAVAYYGTRGRR